MMDRNSLCYWYPKIKDLGILTPRTEIVPLTEQEKKLYYSCVGNGFISERLVRIVKRTIEDNFKLPVFLRTDQASDKHHWEKTCYLTNLEDLEEHLFSLICFSRCVNILGPLPIEAIIIRKYIPMYTSFYAFEGKMPVNKERRYFIAGSRFLCHHPYWIEDAIKKPIIDSKETLSWKQLLELLNQETSKEVELLTNYANKIGKLTLDYWSVDFCLSEEHVWYLIDMAEGKKSWHPKDCIFTQKAKMENRNL